MKKENRLPAQEYLRFIQQTAKILVFHLVNLKRFWLCRNLISMLYSVIQPRNMKQPQNKHFFTKPLDTAVSSLIAEVHELFYFLHFLKPPPPAINPRNRARS